MANIQFVKEEIVISSLFWYTIFIENLLTSCPGIVGL
jgi:hypothetical protein